MADLSTTVPGAPSADSSPAPRLSGTDVLASLTSAQYRKWEATGQLPDATPSPEKTPAEKTDDQAASSPAAPAAPAPSTEATPQKAASEPAKPADQKSRNIKTRHAELDTEIAELNRKLEIRRTLRDELARTDRPTDATSSPSSREQPTTTEWQRYRTHPHAPQPAQFDEYEDYVVAMGVFIADERTKERDRRQQQDAAVARETEHVRQIVTTAQQRLEEYQKTDPEFATKVHPQLLDIVPAFAVPPDQAIGPHHVIAAEILKSPQQAQLLIHFSTPEGVKEWAALCRSVSPGELLKAFGRIEARFEQRAEASADTKDDASKSVPKTVTSAPAPPVTLGQKAATPQDEIETSVRAGDFGAYERVQNARELAARRR